MIFFMASSHQRPKPTEIDDRQDAVGALMSVVSEQTEATWVQFRYRVIRGGAGLGRSQEKAIAMGVERDLDVLTVDDTGSGGLEELRRQLPPHEIAYVVYNNSKGSRFEDKIEAARKMREGARWKKWTAMRKRELAHFMHINLADWAATAEQRAGEAECARLKGLASDLSLVMPPNPPMHNPLKLIEHMCGANTALNTLYRAALLSSNAAFDEVDIARIQQLHASSEVSEHLGRLQATRLARIIEEERLRQAAAKRQSAAAAKKAVVAEKNKKAAENHAQKLSGQRRRIAVVAADDNASSSRLDQGELGNSGSGRESETTEMNVNMSDEAEDEDAGSAWDSRSRASNVTSMTDPPSSFSRSVPRTRSRLLAEYVEENESPCISPSGPRWRQVETPILSPLQRGDSPILAVSMQSRQNLNLAQHPSVMEAPDSLSEGLGSFEWEAMEEYQDEEEDDYNFHWADIEEEARKLAIVMEQAACTLQGLARGRRDRLHVHAIKRGLNIYWEPKHFKARQHHVMVVFVWCPESTSLAMRELPLYHVRDVIDLVNDSALAASETHERIQLMLHDVQVDESSAHGLGEKRDPLQGTQHDMALWKQGSAISVASSGNAEAATDVDLLDDMKAQKRKQSRPLIPHVIHKARQSMQTASLLVANTIAINYFGGGQDSDDSDVEGEEFVLRFGEQELYEELMVKYASILEMPGVLADNSRESPRAWAQRINTKSLRVARGAYRAQREIARRRTLLDLKCMQASRCKSRMVRHEGADAQDVCQTILAVAKPSLRDLKLQFVHPPWWSLTFPARDRGRLRENSLESLAFESESLLDDEPPVLEQESLEQMQSMSLSRIALVSNNVSREYLDHSSGMLPTPTLYLLATVKTELDVKCQRLGDKCNARQRHKDVGKTLVPTSCVRENRTRCRWCLVLSCGEVGGWGRDPKNVLRVFGGWGRVPFNEPYAPSLSTIYDGA